MCALSLNELQRTTLALLHGLTAVLSSNKRTSLHLCRFLLDVKAQGNRRGRQMDVDKLKGCWEAQNKCVLFQVSEEVTCADLRERETPFPP